MAIMMSHMSYLLHRMVMLYGSGEDMLFKRRKEPVGCESIPSSIGGGTRSVREATVALLRRYGNEIGYSVPITEADLSRIRDWFMDMEIELSQDDAEGLLDDAGRDLLVGVSDAFDDLHPLVDAERIDIDDLNRRLGAGTGMASPASDRRSIWGCIRRPDRDMGRLRLFAFLHLSSPKLASGMWIRTSRCRYAPPSPLL